MGRTTTVTLTALAALLAVGGTNAGLPFAVMAAAPIVHDKDKMHGGLPQRVQVLEQQVLALQQQAAALQKALANANATIACLEMAPNGTDLIVKGCNLHVQSGAGSTIAEVNGVGNLIIGYNEAVFGTEVRTGSHNLVIGRGHTYTSFGGLLAGAFNSVTGPASSVTGG